ncbi:MAG: zinc-dependent alcohol dehydrogenase family protein [Armatimonadetes bacterium]|nr:zinc-dependent alcohol dehydrogenase family protein [Armatimonadota bacterium]
MKAAVVNAPHELVITDIEEPRPGMGEILVEVRACGVCGTDLHIYDGQFPAKYPIVMGHEFCGVVVAVGDNVSQISVGDKVAIQPNVSCGSCELCRRGRPNLCQGLLAYGVHMHGGFAQMCIVRHENAFHIGDLSFEAGALVEPLACCLHGINLVGVNAGERVIVFGAGPIGLLLAQLCRLRGASEVVVVDVLEERIHASSSLGFVALSSYELNSKEAEHTHSYELAIDASGATAVIERMTRFVRDGGRLLIFGVAPLDADVPIRPFEIYRRELTLIGAFSLGYEFDSAIRLLSSGQIHYKPLITHRMPLDGIHEALEYKRRGVGLKAIVFPSDEV